LSPRVTPRVLPWADEDKVRKPEDDSEARRCTRTFAALVISVALIDVEDKARIFSMKTVRVTDRHLWIVEIIAYSRKVT